MTFVQVMDCRSNLVEKLGEIWNLKNNLNKYEIAVFKKWEAADRRRTKRQVMKVVEKFNYLLVFPSNPEKAVAQTGNFSRSVRTPNIRGCV